MQIKLNNNYLLHWHRAIKKSGQQDVVDAHIDADANSNSPQLARLMNTVRRDGNRQSGSIRIARARESWLVTSFPKSKQE
jgi:hypothetical protein